MTSRFMILSSTGLWLVMTTQVSLAQNPAMPGEPVIIPRDPPQQAPMVMPETPAPTAPILSHDRPLSSLERKLVTLSRELQRMSTPYRGSNGQVVFNFGQGIPMVVCAPLQMCDIALEPGETVNSINVSDPRWIISPAVSGEGDQRIVHVLLKPTDVSLKGTLFIATPRRMYHIELRSHEHDWMSSVSFNYPDEQQKQFIALQAMQEKEEAARTLETGDRTDDTNLDFNYQIKGNQPFTPVRVWSTGKKTVIQFSRTFIERNEPFPALVARENDTDVIVNYRLVQDRFVVDSVLEDAYLISGVGSHVARVEIKHNGGA